MNESPSYLRLGQQPAPDGGYTLDHFRELLVRLEARLRHYESSGDARAVFQLTYFTFSQQIFKALQERRFRDQAFATDMACRFVGIYETQLALWAARDPGQCRTWQVAFGRMEAGEANLMQAMLLGMNAHINFDLSFCALGSCRQFDDLQAARSSAGLMGVRGVPVSRYEDFLVINRVGWESVPLIQETVLGRHNPLLALGNRLVEGWTTEAGEELLITSRDAAWIKTLLMLHARDEAELSLVARLIDRMGEAWATLTGALTLNPFGASDAWSQWQERGHRLEPELVDGLVAMAIDDFPVAELLLRELAFAGASAPDVALRLVASGRPRLAASFCAQLFRSAPEAQQAALQALLVSGRREGITLARTLCEQGVTLPESCGSAMSLSHHAVLADRLQLQRWLRAPELLDRPLLRRALHDTDHRLARLAPELPDETRTEPSQSLTANDHAQLNHHPDRWLRLCAQHTLAAHTEQTAMQTLIERVLFLKETALFLEADPADLLPVAESMEPLDFDAGERILAAGGASTGLHVVVHGTVRVEQRRAGASITVARLGRGEAMGELALLNGSDVTADCVADGPVQTLRLSADELGRLLHQHPRMSVALLRVLARRLADTTRKVAESRPG